MVKKKYSKKYNKYRRPYLRDIRRYKMPMYRRPETKYYDTVATSLTCSNTWSLSNIFTPAQGTTTITRVGNSVFVKHIYIRCELSIHPSATNSMVRVCLVNMGSPGAIAPATQMFLEDKIWSFRNMDYAKHGRVLKNWNFQLNTSKGNDSVYFKYACKFNKPVEWITGSSTVFEKNQIGLMYLSDEGTNTPQLNGSTRITFTDN